MSESNPTTEQLVEWLKWLVDDAYEDEHSKPDWCCDLDETECAELLINRLNRRASQPRPNGELAPIDIVGAVEQLAKHPALAKGDCITLEMAATRLAALPPDGTTEDDWDNVKPPKPKSKRMILVPRDAVVVESVEQLDNAICDAVYGWAIEATVSEFSKGLATAIIAELKKQQG